MIKTNFLISSANYLESLCFFLLMIFSCFIAVINEFHYNVFIFVYFFLLKYQEILYDRLVQFTVMTQSRLSHSSIMESTLNFFYRVDSVTGSDFNGWHHYTYMHNHIIRFHKKKITVNQTSLY